MGLNYPSMPLSRVTLSAVCSTGPLEAWQPIKIMKQPVTVTVVLFFGLVRHNKLFINLSSEKMISKLIDDNE